MTRPEHIIVNHIARKHRQGDERSIAVVSFARPDMIDPEFIEETGGEILALTASESSPPRIVIDFTGVRFISSGLLAALVVVRDAALERGGAMRIAAVGVEIQEVFRITKMTTVVDIDDDVRTAVRHLTEN